MLQYLPIFAGINVSLPCTDNGLVYMQLCLTLGTEPYTLLNGTYQTFTMYFPRTCEGIMLVFLAELPLSTLMTYQGRQSVCAMWTIPLKLCQQNFVLQ